MPLPTPMWLQAVGAHRPLHWPQANHGRNAGTMRQRDVMSHLGRHEARALAPAQLRDTLAMSTALCCSKGEAHLLVSGRHTVSSASAAASASADAEQHALQQALERRLRWRVLRVMHAPRGMS